MKNFEAWLQKACDVVSLKADFSFDVFCSDGHKIHSIARICGVGDVNGILIVNNYEEVKNYVKCLEVNGYGFAVLDEPRDDELFDQESIREMFRDWGWAG